MTKWSGDGYAAPADYAELFEQYYDLVMYIVRKNGIREADVEDVGRDLLVTFMEKDAIHWYRPPCYCDKPKLRKVDPDRNMYECPKCDGVLFKVKSGWKRSRFPGFFRDWMSLYIRQHRDRQMVRDRKEPYRIMVEVDSELTIFLETAREKDAYRVTATDEEIAIGAADANSWIVQAARHLKILTVRGQRDLAVLFDALIRQFEEHGDVVRNRLAEEIGASPQVCTVMLRELRTELEVAGLASWRDPW